METKLIDKLPYSLEAVERINRQFSVINARKAEVSTHKRRLEKIEVFNNCIECGLALGCGFIVETTDGAEVGYVVTNVDFVNYEFVGTRFDLDEPDRTIKVVDSIEGSKIKGIQGHINHIKL